MAVREIELAIEAATGRLDVALAQQLPELSRAVLQELIRSGQVRLNGAVVSKPSTQVVAGDQVQLWHELAADAVPEPEAIPLELVHEDEQVLVVNKPAGMVVHPAPGHASGTLVNAVLGYLPELAAGERRRPGIVHRLDKDTSGLILVARSDQALADLQRKFKRREVKKTYLGLVDGSPPTPEGEVRAAIGRDPRNRQRYAVLESDSAKPAVTRYRTRKRFPEHSLLELQPITGRTHQLRIHLQAVGCPIVGDRVYGRRSPSLPVERQMLHAWRLELRLPGEQAARSFEAPLPADLEAAIQQAGEHGLV